MPDNPYPAWRQRRCAHCAAGLPWTTNEIRGHFDPIIPYESGNRYKVCTAPTEAAYIAELETKLDESRSWARAANSFAWAHERSCPRHDADLPCDCGLDLFLRRPRIVVKGYQQRISKLEAALEAAGEATAEMLERLNEQNSLLAKAIQERNRAQAECEVLQRDKFHEAASEEQRILEEPPGKMLWDTMRRESGPARIVEFSDLPERTREIYAIAERDIYAIAEREIRKITKSQTGIT